MSGGGGGLSRGQGHTARQAILTGIRATVTILEQYGKIKQEITEYVTPKQSNDVRKRHELLGHLASSLKFRRLGREALGEQRCRGMRKAQITMNRCIRKK